MECPKCKEEIKIVRVYSQCWQRAEVNAKGKIISYGKVEDVLETLKIEHQNNCCCVEDITSIIEEQGNTKTIYG